MRNVLTIIKKELNRVFTDRKILLVLLVPGIFLYLLYSFMGSAMANSMKPDEPLVVWGVGVPIEIEDTIESINKDNDVNLNIDYRFFTSWNDYLSHVSHQETLDKIKTGQVDLLIVFDEDFLNEVYENGYPTVVLYYNRYSLKSIEAQSTMLALIQGSLFKLEVYDDISDGNTLVTEIVAMLLPMLVMMLLISGCMSVVPESIAGEKERGTMATLLSTPVKRGEIAIGKIVSLAITALVTATSSFLGLVLSLPKMFDADMGGVFDMFRVTDLLLLYLLMISVVLVIVGMLTVISAFAKNIKEASLLSMPFMIFSTFIGILNMSLGIPSNIAYYIIPLYNSVASIGSVLSGKIIVANFIMTIVSNLIYATGLTYLVSRMFNSERIMFKK